MNRARPQIFGFALCCAMTGTAFAQTHVAAPPGGSLSERYHRAEAALAEARAKADGAATDSERLTAEAVELEQKLLTTAARVQELDIASSGTAAELMRLNDEIAAAEGRGASDRNRLAQLLGVMQRIRLGERDGFVATPEESLRAMRATLQLSGALQPLNRERIELRNHLKQLVNLRSSEASRQTEAAAEQQALEQARADLAGAVAQKHSQSAAVAQKAQELQKVAGEIAHETESLKALIDRVAALRAPSDKARPAKPIGSGGVPGTLLRSSLHPPLPGKAVAGDPAGPGQTPGANGPTGLWYDGSAGAEAVAPGDSAVVFAGAYQKLGQVLILELAGGYHLALAGLNRVDVHVGDLVLAGEPVGTLPQGKSAPLYMELRRNGKVVDLAPWLAADIGKAKGS